ncbi:hypothetical protein BOTCAL_0220g00170 [Botryotinia calthae]|uniref:Uncharacterized protein n=1 Tax=Botryotinia calthae TaxID=38488 RepID=A0A4Y8D0U2_9HELO|nr:hypothetical protein BOTCAL_0220g00170 [Botryotinia calthae]
MNIDVPGPKDGGSVQHGDPIHKAVELVGNMLEQIQIELEKIPSQGGKVPSQVDSIEEEKNESQKRYKHLQGNYKNISEELKAFGREMASTGDRSGQIQAELKLAQAKKDIEKLKAECENLRTKCNEYLVKAHQPPQDVQRLQTQLEELKNQNAELQRNKLKDMENDPDVWRRWFAKNHLDDSSGPMDHSQQKPRDKLLRSAFDVEPDSIERERYFGRAIFQFLCEEIFFQPLFGLDDEDEGGKMEAGLAAFEKKIREASADDIFKNLDYLDWRKLTYRCGKLIRKRDAETRIVAFASALEDFLKPLPKLNSGRMETRLLDICRRAFMFSQKLRAEPVENYKIYFPEPGDAVVVHEEGDPSTPEMEIWGKEGGHPTGDDETVAYTWFGGLYFTNHRENMWYPLVAAKVVVKGQGEGW